MPIDVKNVRSRHKSKEGPQIYAALALLSALAIAGCDFYDQKTSQNEDEITSKSVSFSKLEADIFSQSCTHCHHTVDFTNYNDVAHSAQEIYDRTIGRVGDMPLSGPPLTAYQRKELAVWFGAGAPREAGDPPFIPPIGPVGPPVPSPSPSASPGPPVSPTYSSITNLIFQPRCAKCHAVGGEADDVDLYTWSTLTGADGWVTAGNAAQSQLYQDIVLNGKGRMPPLSQGAGLSVEQISAIETWINEGAQNN